MGAVTGAVIADRAAVKGRVGGDRWAGFPAERRVFTPPLLGLAWRAT